MQQGGIRGHQTGNRALGEPMNQKYEEQKQRKIDAEEKAKVEQFDFLLTDEDIQREPDLDKRSQLCFVVFFF